MHPALKAFLWLLMFLITAAGSWYVYLTWRDQRCNALSQEGIQCVIDHDWQTAARRLKKFMSECPTDCRDDCRAISYYIDVCLHENRLSEAETWTRHLLQIDPQDPEGLYYRGALLALRGQFRGALPLLTSSVPEVRHNHPYADFYLGVTLLGVGREDEACNPFRQFRSSVPIESSELTSLVDNILKEHCQSV